MSSTRVTLPLNRDELMTVYIAVKNLHNKRKKQYDSPHQIERRATLTGRDHAKHMLGVQANLLKRLQEFVDEAGGVPK